MDAQAIENASTTSVETSVETGSTPPQPVIEKASDFFLRFATRARPFNLPTWSLVTAKGMEHFNDPSLRCLRRRYGAEYIYIYQLTRPAPIANQSIKFFCNGEEISFDLSTQHPFERKGNRTQGNRAPMEKEKGVLITFQDAGMREHDDIPSADFDKALAAFNLHVIVSTRMQPVHDCKGSFNGNRFCVVRIPEDMNMIPEYLPVRSPRGKLHNFKSTYKNQARQCDVCWVKHIGQCPKKKAMFEAKEKKEKMREEGEIQSKIISDSTLRLANPLGTKSEICTMSGGGLGQVTQAVMDDPDTDNMKEIFIVGGANDVKYDQFSMNQFCENIEVSLKKVEGLAAAYPEKSITLVTSPPPPDSFNDGLSDSSGDGDCVYEDDAEDNDLWMKKEYLQRRIQQMITQSDEKNLPNLHSLQVKYGVDDSGHPTPGGTSEILEQIGEKSIAEDFIWDKDYICADKIYTMVQSIYLYGCNMCDKYGADVSREVHRCRLLCDSCFEIVDARADTEAYPLIQEIIAEFDRIDENGDFDDRDDRTNDDRTNDDRTNDDRTNDDRTNDDRTNDRNDGNKDDGDNDRNGNDDNGNPENVNDGKGNGNEGHVNDGNGNDGNGIADSATASASPNAPVGQKRNLSSSSDEEEDAKRIKDSTDTPQNNTPKVDPAHVPLPDDGGATF